jgi:hypothetical protein
VLVVCSLNLLLEFCSVWHLCDILLRPWSYFALWANSA